MTLGPLSQGRVNIKMPSYKYWDSHYKEKTVSWLSYIHNRYPCTWTFILKQAKGTALISNKMSHCKISQSSLEAMRFFYLELYDCCKGYLSSNTIRCLIEYWNGSQVFKGSTHGTDSLQVDELFSSSGFFCAPDTARVSGGCWCYLHQTYSIHGHGAASYKKHYGDIESLAQDCSNSSALAMELLQSCAKCSAQSSDNRKIIVDVWKENKSNLQIHLNKDIKDIMNQSLDIDLNCSSAPCAAIITFWYSLLYLVALKLIWLKLMTHISLCFLPLYDEWHIVYIFETLMI